MGGDRRQKRAWLRLVGAIDDRSPSGSVAKALTPTSIDTTLGSIKGDDVWVALACLDAIENRADVTMDIILTRHVIKLGIQCTTVGGHFDITSKQVIYKLAIRKVLLRYRRMTDVWEQVYGVASEQKVSKDPVDMHDEEGDFDAWDEVAESNLESFSPSVSLLHFIKESFLDHAMQLASSGQITRLITFIRALPTALFDQLFPHRLSITKAIILSSAAANSDLDQLRICRLLPGASNGKELDLWTDCKETSQGTNDVTDSKEVYQVLSSHHLVVSDRSQGSLSLQALDEDQLSPDSLLGFYSSCIDALEQKGTSTKASIQLANIVSSDKLGLTADENFLRLAEDLQLLHPLVQGPSSCRDCSSWTLRRFRDELNSRSDLSQKQAMATLYFEEAKSDSDAIRAAREGAVPFLRSISQRSSLHSRRSPDIHQSVTEGFTQAILALADKGRIRIVTSLLNGSSQCGAEISNTDKAKIALACLLGMSSQSDVATQREMDQLAASTLANLQSVTFTGHEISLRDCIGAALNQGTGHQLPPSQLHRFFGRLDLPSLRHFIERCQLHLALCQRLAPFYNALTVSWLFNCQGQHEEQASCVNRVVRFFAREHKPQNQWASLTRELFGSVGSEGSLDALDKKDIARLMLEGALRTGDVRIYSYVMNEHKSLLSNMEQENIVLSASREFYDNATSTNVHQGDMKTAHEILTQCGHLTSTRIEQEKAFIEATSRLCSFRIQSMLRPGIPHAPIEIRLSIDRIDFIKRLLETKEDAYKSPDLILDLAQKLCAVPGGSNGEVNDKLASRPLIESRTLSLLTEAALGQTDYTCAQSSCERLVANVAKLEKRVEQSAINHAKQHEPLQEVLIQVRENAYRSCFLLCNQHGWEDHGSRLTWCSYVLAYCPSDQIERYLKTWRQLEESFQEDLVKNPLKDWDQVAIQLKSGGGGLASSLASMGGLGALESLSPFGTLFASTRSNATSSDESKQSAINHVRNDSLPQNGSPSSRAARLFDSLGSGNTGNSSSEGTYLDPAERAARAARRFFGGFA